MICSFQYLGADAREGGSGRRLRAGRLAVVPGGTLHAILAFGEMRAYDWHIAKRKAYAMAVEFANAHDILRLAAGDGRAAIEATRRGLPVSAVDALIETGRLSLSEIDRIVLPRKTLSHRRTLGALTSDQSDRLIRVARIIAAAEDTFGSTEKARRWLRRPTTALDGEAPLELLDTSEGSRQVERLILRIDHGLGA